MSTWGLDGKNYDNAPAPAPTNLFKQMGAYGNSNFAGVPTSTKSKTINKNKNLAQHAILDIYLLANFFSNDYQCMRKQIQTNNVDPPIGHATVIFNQGIFISARHIFNGYSADDLVIYSHNTKEFYDFLVIEDGADSKTIKEDKQKRDYMLGILKAFHFTNNWNVPCPIKLAEDAPYIDKILFLTNSRFVQASITLSNNEQRFYDVTDPKLKSQAGDCGLPWLTSDYEMFALHSKRCELDLFGSPKIGLAISEISKHSKANFKSNFEQIRTRSDDSNNLIKFLKIIRLSFNYQFDHFQNSNPQLAEHDESGKRRDFALGATPLVSRWNDTVQKVLLRLFKKGKAKYKSNNTEIYYCNNEKKFHVKIASAKPKIDLSTDSKILNFIKEHEQPKNWYIKVIVPYFQLNNQRKWMPLYGKKFDKDGSVIKDKNNKQKWGYLDMGHKFPALGFWNGKLKEYREEKSKIYNGKKYNQQTISEKLEHFNARYEKYQTSGMKSWKDSGGRRSEYIRNFMNDPDNYTLQMSCYNSGMGAGDEKKLYGDGRGGGYQAPDGYEWQNIKKKSRSGEYSNNWQLVLKNKQAVMDSKTFDNLSDGNCQVYMHPENKFMPVNKLGWLSETAKNAPRAKGDFVRNKLGETFQLRIFYNNTNKNKINTILKTHNTNTTKYKKSMVVSENNTKRFFSAQFDKNVNHRPRLYDNSEKLLDELNEQMANI